MLLCETMLCLHFPFNWIGSGKVDADADPSAFQVKKKNFPAKKGAAQILAP